MKTKKIILIGIFAAIATVLMFFELSLPIFPSFLKLDVSTVIVLIAGYVISPVSGVFVALVKDLIHLMFTHRNLRRLMKLGMSLFISAYHLEFQDAIKVPPLQQRITLIIFISWIRSNFAYQNIF